MGQQEIQSGPNDPSESPKMAWTDRMDVWKKDVPVYKVATEKAD